MLRNFNNKLTKSTKNGTFVSIIHAFCLQYPLSFIKITQNITRFYMQNAFHLFFTVFAAPQKSHTDRSLTSLIL